ncbi:hypothetical protein [Kordia sp.]|uniref:hypothetical protein n=1 Tax=Kordia sp. TaxID=1965332 RepID=UPI003B5B8EE0
MTNIQKVSLFLCLFTITFSLAQEDKIVPAKKVELTDMVKDVQIIRKKNDNFKMVWWIPNEYWKVSIQDTSMEGFTDQLLEVFRGYTIVCVINTEISPFGTLKRLPVKIKVKDKNGVVYSPLEEEDIPEEYNSMLNSMKPGMAQMLGQFGKQMEFFVFPERAKNGSLIASPLSKGEFTVLFNKDEEFKFKLPLSSMVEKKICPTDNELLNGNWEFCPWHGKKLKIQTK